MSYILDALKKADAERHLGELPGLHAQPFSGLAQPADARPWQRRTIWMVVAILCLLIALLTWHIAARRDTPAQAVAAVSAPLALTVTPQLPAAAIVASELSPPPPAPKPPPKLKSASIAPPLKPEYATSKPTEPVSTIARLPENLQRELPALAVGGSMYSNNPADRMLLIDKRLLHEGDEVAPGLVLENLMPKAAILRYKGYRFQIAF